MRSAPAFQLVTMLFRSLPTMASSVESTIEAKYAVCKSAGMDSAGFVTLNQIRMPKHQWPHLGEGIIQAHYRPPRVRIAFRSSNFPFKLTSSLEFRVSSFPGRRRRPGWGGFEPPVPFGYTRFPGVHNRPLCHPSIGIFPRRRAARAQWLTHSRERASDN